ncbi:Asp-tRNA(Asn)/Glu-tRNA(Gln) amidotransferase subunit GatC [Candidatus Peregrinibacteria bacterium]|nr:Asp-tRNA(Asn)/Glu-tRNA(Gln) amidotransferase subunit GatC [Candidatus Peregrinibacteria bacterium]
MSENSNNLIDTAKIKHIAHLSRIGLSDQEAEKYAGQLASVMDYMKILEEVNTDGVEMTSQVTGLKSVTREDEVKVEATPVELLAVSTLPKISGQISVKAVIAEE